MIRQSKWIEIHAPDEPVVRVAARTLDGRLRLVAHYLPLASAAADDDDEHVHQTRVATRRAMTTVSIFNDYLPAKSAKWFRKELKRVRRAAGEARDLDVLADHLNERIAERGGDKTCQQLVAWINDLRRDAQKPIRQVSARLEKKRFKRRAKRLVKKLLKRVRHTENGAGTFGELGRLRMRQFVDRFFGFTHDDLADIEKLHQFRVCGKHMRYAMEIFAGAFRRAFREELYPQVGALQEQLGELNDHAVARGYFERWLGEAKDEERKALLRELIDEEAATVCRRHDAFLQAWTAQRALALRQQFLAEICPAAAEPQIVAVG